MSIKSRHFLLIAGIVTVMGSFLFFGRKHNVYTILLWSGVITCCVSFLWIIVSDDYLKHKLLWAGIIILSILIHLQIEPVLINMSYKIYVAEHRQTLASINKILGGKNGEIWITRDTVKTEGVFIDKPDRIRLLKAREEVGAYLIFKDHNKIYYGLWGFLDVRIGITYILNGKKPDGGRHHITGNWFH
jgi:hypothetical protein